MNFDLDKATIFMVLSGSRAYGFSEPNSDYDYRGIAIPPLDTYLGIYPKFEQAVDAKTKHVYKNYPEGFVQPDSDMQVMELTKFCRLALDANPSVLEILFTDPSDYIRKHPIMNELLDNKEMFLSKRAKSRYAGYAYQQIKRIERHKRWLDHPVHTPPNRKDFGLNESSLISSDQIGAAEALIVKEINKFNINQNDLPEHTKIDLSNELERMLKAVWIALNNTSLPIGKDQKFNSIEDALHETVMQSEGFSENFIELLRKEKKYRAAKQEYDSYQRWLTDRNPARAELERKFGMDCKHAAHVYRLLVSAREVLETGKILVKRPDAEVIRSIRAGAWTYEKICEFAEKEDLALNELMKTSKLPSAPDMEKAQKIVINMILNYKG